MKKFLYAVLAIVLMAGIGSSCLAEAESRNPLVTPQSVHHVKTDDEFINILLLGIENGFEGFRQSASSSKKDLLDNHTDVLMLVSINKTQGKINLVSIPRDTLTYVPGVHGIYKLNAAFNCASTVKEGLRRSCDAVSWLLGGIKIDAYAAVDMGGMIALGDAMGGIDFDVDMTYTGCAGHLYKKGYQHLDGLGIMEYVRARQNATVDANDLGRTGRGRRMITAIIQKLRGNWPLVNDLWALSQKSSINFFTNITDTIDLASLYEVVQNLEHTEIGSYVLEGKYITALSEWNFTFTDQAHRLQVLKDAFGMDAEEIPYVSKKYTDWLLNDGMFAVKTIRQAWDILDYAKDTRNLTAAQEESIKSFEALYDAAVTAFDAAADDINDTKLTRNLASARRELSAAGEQMANQFGYPGKLRWNINKFSWFQDPLINDYPNIEWR